MIHINTKRLTWRALACGTAAAGALLFAAEGPASAATQAKPSVTDACPADPGYDFSSPAHNFIDMVSSSEGGGGTHLTITLTKGRSTSTTVSGTLSTSEGVFLASASVSLGLSVQQTITTSVAYGGDWTVPQSWSVGYLHAGADRESAKWSYGEYYGNCSYHVLHSGTANMPYHAPAFWHNKQATGGANINS